MDFVHPACTSTSSAEVVFFVDPGVTLTGDRSAEPEAPPGPEAPAEGPPGDTITGGTRRDRGVVECATRRADDGVCFFPLSRTTLARRADDLEWSHVIGHMARRS